MNKLFNKKINSLLKLEDTFNSISTFIDESLKEFKDDVNYEEVKELILDIYNITKTLEYIDSKKEENSILENTLSMYEYDFQDEQIEVFKELIKYDKSCIMNDKRVFYRLTILLEKIFSHLEALNNLSELEQIDCAIQRGIAKTKHPKVIEAITPKIKTLKDYQLINNTPSSQTALNIYNEFNSNPLEISAMYYVLNYIDKDTFLEKNKEKIDTLYNQRNFLNSASKLEDTQIFRSCQISSFILYKKGVLADITLNLNKHIPYTTLAKCINNLLNSFFDYMFNSNLSKKHIEKQVQTRDFFNGLEILEYRTKSNYKKHPIFENI
ncbi:hypothetical protein CRV01_05645 [Arcobacter sp. CECT 8983]|uniref:hypothetical protein n=1 Tax=Arcobacter sp. CECT 8983 TaxID=2044508 RepID=UPI00100A4734|nr:hypothetical protein [Arcobacter sp. CECT 8983]RXJ90632.1 hypothetical protein CRV01_05645 [Arcobacter sp. CECT 8983]